MRYSLLLLLCVITNITVHAQQFGATPARVKWMQIESDTVRIIFPRGLEQPAQRAANIVHSMQQKYASTIGDSMKKVSIVLNPYTTFSNGYVGLSPWRSEFYLTAPQDPFTLGAQNWVDNLAIHEYRHVQQYNNFNKGLSKLASFVLGQDGRALANAAAIPDWFFEGDAVFNETKLSQQGRGKLPFFLNGYKSLFAAGKQYPFMKLRNGSLKNYVPNHYPLGYMLVAYGYAKYGDSIWRKVTQDAASFKPLFYPMQGAIKKHTGISYQQFVHDAMAYYQQQWKLQEPAMNWLTKVEQNNVINYQYPYTMEDGSVLVLKQSNNSIPTFYTIKNKVESKLAVRDIAYNGYFSYSNGKLVYANYKPNVRWGYDEYSDIQVMDMATKQTKSITHKRRFFSPDISSDGKLIAAIEMLPNQSSVLTILSADSGKTVMDKSIAGMVFAYPKFSASNDAVYVVARIINGWSAIFKVSLKDGKRETIVNFSNKAIGYLQVKNDTLLFTASYNGNDEVFAYVENSKAVYQLANYTTGIYQATLQNDGNLIASVFTANGYRLTSVQPQWAKVDFDKGNLTDLYVADAYQQQDHSFLTSLPYRKFETKKYRKATGLINFHSWRPYFDDPEFSFTIYGENVLNTFQSQLAYTYNQNEGSSKVGYTGIYGGMYVQPYFSVSQTWQRNALYNPTTRVFWNEANAQLGLQLPFNFSGGKQYRYLTLSSSFNTSQVRWTGIAKGNLLDYDINYLTTRLQFSSQIQKAVQQIYPRWAQSFTVQYRNIINKFTAQQLLLNAALYLPGIGTNHSLVLNASYQSRDTAGQYYFSNSMPFSRGYRAVDFPRMYKLAANYHFPLFYPDWGFGNIVYCLRIRANAFYDFTQTKSLRTGNTFNFSTTGGEIYFDIKWWNQQAVTFGIRYSHLLDKEFSGTTQPNQWELIVPVNLFGR